MTPTCSTTNCVSGLEGSCTNATGSSNPVANTTARSCAETDELPHVKIAAARHVLRATCDVRRAACHVLRATCITVSLHCDEQRQGERRVPVDPLIACGEAGVGAHVHDLVGRVFVRALGPDPLVTPERHARLRGGDPHDLIGQA